MENNPRNSPIVTPIGHQYARLVFVPFVQQQDGKERARGRDIHHFVAEHHREVHVGEAGVADGGLVQLQHDAKYLYPWLVICRRRGGEEGGGGGSLKVRDDAAAAAAVTPPPAFSATCLQEAVIAELND